MFEPYRLRALEGEYADAMQPFARKCPVAEIDAEQDAWHVLSQCQHAMRNGAQSLATHGPAGRAVYDKKNPTALPSPRSGIFF